MNPFSSREVSLAGPATDALPVVPNDTLDLPDVAIGLYVETGGAVCFLSESGSQRTMIVADFSILPVGVKRVRASGTTASGIHALVLT